MALTKNNYGGVDLLATATDLDKRLTALENAGKDAPEPEKAPAASPAEPTLVASQVG